MESIYTEIALYGSKNWCARTYIVFLPISEICNGTVSLIFYELLLTKNTITSKRSMTSSGFFAHIDMKYKL